MRKNKLHFLSFKGCGTISYHMVYFSTCINRIKGLGFSILSGQWEDQSPSTLLNYTTLIKNLLHLFYILNVCKARSVCTKQFQISSMYCWHFVIKQWILHPFAMSRLILRNQYEFCINATRWLCYCNVCVCFVWLPSMNYTGSHTPPINN